MLFMHGSTVHFTFDTYYIVPRKRGGRGNNEKRQGKVTKLQNRKIGFETILPITHRPTTIRHHHYWECSRNLIQLNNKYTHSLSPSLSPETQRFVFVWCVCMKNCGMSFVYLNTNTKSVTLNHLFKNSMLLVKSFGNGDNNDNDDNDAETVFFFSLLLLFLLYGLLFNIILLFYL